MRVLSTAPAYLAVLLFGCSDITIIARDDDDSTSGPVDDDDSTNVSDDDDSSISTGELLLSPTEFDFGEQLVHCTADVTLQLTNVGEGPLEITDMSYVSTPGLSATGLAASSFQLAAQATTEVTISYQPLTAQHDEGTLTVTSDVGTEVATQVGVALAPSTASDEFLQQGNRSVDILWVVDSSCSMAREQEALGDNFATFLQIVDQLTLDYRIGVITADLDDQGLLQGSPAQVTPTTPNAEQVFAANVLVGQLGSGAEQGFDSLRRAVIDGAAGDFLRSTAQLRVISVSDEDDQSVALASVADYMAELQSLKASPSYVIHSDISGGDSGCISTLANADPAPRYVEATTMTGGLSTSICEAGWVQTLTNLAWLSDSYADTFVLSQTAIPASVTPLVDGTPVTLGWTWNDPLNAVVFEPDAVPDDGSLIRIEYAVDQPCTD